MRIETLAIHAGKDIDPVTGAIMPAIHLSTTFQRSEENQFAYSRVNNPNRQALEDCLVALEEGAAAAAFASGMAASAAVLQTLSAGDHILLPQDLYFGVRELATKLMPQWELSHTVVDMTDLSEVKAAIRPNTRMIWIETPSNPLLNVLDISAIAGIARYAGALLVSDSTWTTPLLQRSLVLGADVVIHSTTKYLSGHSDVVGGVVIVKEEGDFLENLRQIQGIAGAVPSPFDCWLILRGIRTLPYRMRGHCHNAGKVAQFLADHPAVHTVRYPGLPSHPGHEIAGRQMSGFGGMLSFQVNGGIEQAAVVAASTKLFAQATSLGGVESLIEHRAVAEGEGSQTPVDLLRVSVGLEHPDDLIADLAAALETEATPALLKGLRMRK